ncbi:hypothetical protein KTE49_22945 [Burkholderia multivorans]|uniref:hypothetical protein n=1 Tax=Burkholderia multivorans TaxID=87883 RepID=UPI0011B29A0D|nr:hypothetical protein [Burkholderia multivorans]MBJ9617708.1 hypothetical protein [Burkholderia multivorans]MBU9331427.1 hypothetical protein [Burkholderia multivorans]MBU9533295.1 hypothetical protein [Burkholderia multivorans]
MRSNFWIFAILFFAGLRGVWAASPSDVTVLTKSGGESFTFVCEVGQPEIKVFAGDKIGEEADALIDQKLDDSDSCVGAEWIVNQLAESDVTLVMINPGRSGANVQMNVYALQGDKATFAGYLPVGADYVGKAGYFYDFDQADGSWRRVYEVVDGKIILNREIQLMQSGDVCVDKGGTIGADSACGGRRLKASAKKPLCIVYEGHVGKISLTKDCSELTGRAR